MLPHSADCSVRRVDPCCQGPDGPVTSSVGVHECSTSPPGRTSQQAVAGPADRNGTRASWAGTRQLVPDPARDSSCPSCPGHSRPVDPEPSAPHAPAGGAGPPVERLARQARTGRNRKKGPTHPRARVAPARGRAQCQRWRTPWSRRSPLQTFVHIALKRVFLAEQRERAAPHMETHHVKTPARLHAASTSSICIAIGP